MRIEELTKELLQGLGERDLYNLRLRAVQIFNKHFRDSATPSAGSLERGDFLGRYALLRKEMDNRDMHPAWSEVDSYLLRHKMMDGLDPALMGEVVLKSGCVVVGGAFASDPKGAETCDVWIDSGLGFSEAIERALNSLITKQVSRPVTFHHDKEGLGDVCLPLFDLKLTPRISLVKVDVSKEEEVEDECSYCTDCTYATIKGMGEVCPDCGETLSETVPVWKSDPDEVIVSKPGFEQTENEIRYRLRNPDGFQDGSFRRIALQQSKPRVFAIIGKLEGATTTTLQALRFPKGDGWTIAKASAWTRAHPDVLKKGANLLKIDGLEIQDSAINPVEKDAGSVTGFSVKKVDEDEHIVGGIIYEPDVEDAQGDMASAEEIEKAAYYFMEFSQNIKVMHQGRPINAKVVECFIAPADFEIGDQMVTKGSWWLSVRINDAAAWKAVKSGEIEGFSMGGVAQAA